MRFTNLEPRWFVLESGGPRVGLSFDCPCCRSTRIAVLFHHEGREVADDSYILAHHNGQPHVWNLNGQEDFATLTLTPSIDVSHAGHWHGFITNGEVR